MKRLAFALLLVIVLGAFSVFLLRDKILLFVFRPTTSQALPGVNGQTPTAQKNIEVVASNLTVPWGLAFLPDGSVLVTERSGTLRKIGADGTSTPVPGVRHIGEGGLLGIALHPQFSNNQFIYLYLTTQTDSGLRNRIDRYRYVNGTLENRTAILENIPGAQNHDGGRIAFGPDGMLYVTTGDAGNGQLSQDTNSLAGKILRMTPDGGVPSDNPFKNLVYSYGHRNPQGLAWDEQGRLWSTEHGRSGVQSGFDEVNIIEPGKNYGWPDSQGDTVKPGTQAPYAHSGANETWAPASALMWDDSIWFGGLRGEALYEIKLNDPNRKVVSHFRSEFGRIRTVALGSDGFIYLTTSNTDGRGTVYENDDKIIKINPALLHSNYAE